MTKFRSKYLDKLEERDKKHKQKGKLWKTGYVKGVI